jgi:hypothetical protein
MYEGLTIVQYDRGNLGEFICLSLYKKMFNVDVYFEKRKNNLGWYFMNIDGSMDALMYDYHRPRIESVTFQKLVFNSCIYEELLAGNIASARNIMNGMINYRLENPDIAPENLELRLLSNPDTSYDPTKKTLTRIHNFDNIDLAAAFPGAEIVNVYCRPEKRWLFKFFFMLKKSEDGFENNSQRLKNGIEEFWNFNWNKNLEYKEGAVNIDAYDIFLGNVVEPFNKDFESIFKENFETNNALIKIYNLDHTRDYVSSDELLNIVKSLYSSYT